MEHTLKTEPAKDKPLTHEEVMALVHAFLQHVKDNWATYKDNLPALRRTMMYYNEFNFAVRSLPENARCAIEFDPRDELDEDKIEKYFGSDYTVEIANLIYGAWPYRAPYEAWKGYEEPIEDTAEAYQAEYPRLFATVEAAQARMDDPKNADFGTYDGRRVRIGASGMPEFLYRGFSTIEEFPAQTAFLDTIRNHPRIQLGLQRFEEDLERARNGDYSKRIDYEEVRGSIAQLAAGLEGLSDEDLKGRISTIAYSLGMHVN